MKKLIAIFSLLLMFNMQAALAQANDAQLTALCDQLQTDAEGTAASAIERRLPMEDPANVFSKVSCLDALLNFRFNIGAFFDLSALLDKLIDKACAKAQGAMNEQLGRINQDIGRNLNLPYGAGGAQAGFGLAPTVRRTSSTLAQGIPLYYSGKTQGSWGSKSARAGASAPPAPQDVSLLDRIKQWFR